MLTHENTKISNIFTADEKRVNNMMKMPATPDFRTLPQGLKRFASEDSRYFEIGVRHTDLVTSSDAMEKSSDLITNGEVIAVIGNNLSLQVQGQQILLRGRFRLVTKFLKQDKMNIHVYFRIAVFNLVCVTRCCFSAWFL